jgi:predicted metal-dependent phosphoesterase TrpH
LIFELCGGLLIESLCADLHIHTVYSADSLVQPKTLVDLLVSHSFIKVAAITDHNSVRGCRVAVELASAYPDVLIIPGVEISTREGDILVLGTDELPSLPWTPEVVVDFARSVGGVSVVAHPYREYGMGDRARDFKVDAVEVLNGGSSQVQNDLAKKLAGSLGLPGVGGSDAHQVSELFGAYSEVDAALDVDAVLKAVKKGLVSAKALRRRG